MQTRAPKRGKRWVWAIIIVLLILVLASGVLSFIVGWKATHPSRIPIRYTPAEYALKYQDVSFPSRVDHLKLSGWLIPAAKPTTKIVVESHGYHGNRSNEKPFLASTKALHDAGYAVLMFDYRGEGESAGSLVSIGDYEQRDLEGAIDFAKSKGYTDIGVLGWSMGASTALEVATKDSDVKATIADSPFADLNQYLEVNMPVWSHLPSFPFTAEILWELEKATGIEPSQASPEADMHHFGQKPLLLIAGTADTTIPMKNSQLLAQEVHSDPNASLWIVKGAKHIGAYKVEPGPYEQRVVAFFNKYLS
jgi:uncharacterized protein